jgi:hypothetical protein
MNGIVVNRGSRAINEPWFRQWQETGALQPAKELMVIFDPVNTPGASLLALKLIQDMALDRLQTVGVWHEKSKRAPDANGGHGDHAEDVIHLLDEWMADESGYDEKTWPELKAGLERERLSSRHLFDD